MVKVPGPEDIPQVSPQRLRAPSVRVMADDFGAGVAEEAARFGNAALKTALGGVAEGLRGRRQEAEDGAFVSAAVTEGRDRLSTLFDEMEGLATDGPEDLATTFQRRAAEESEALVDDLRQRGQRPSSSGMVEAMRQLEGLQADFGVEAAVFENNARVGRLARGLDDTLAAAQARAFSHPEQLHGLLADVERAAARLAPHIDTDTDTVEAFRKGAPERIATAALSGIMALDPAGARDSLAAGDFDNLLGDDMKGALSRQAVAEAGLAETRQAARQALERQDAGRDLAAAIAAGGKGFADVAQALNGGIIDESQAHRLDGLLEARLKADKRLAEALAGEATLDGDDPLQRRALDRYYQDIFRPRLDGLAEPDVQRALTDLFRRAGRVPDAMTRELRAGILSGDPDREAMAAGRLATLQCHHPQPLPQPHRPIAGPEPFDTIPADEQARAHAIAGFANLGVPPARAVALADQKLERHDVIELAPPPGPPDDIHCQDPDPGFHRPLPETDADLLPIAVPGRDRNPRPAAPPGFVWEDGDWRRETAQEAARRRFDDHIAGIGSAPVATGGDGQGHDGGNDGGFHLLAAEGAAGGGGGGSSGGGAPSTGPTVKAGAAKPAGSGDASGDGGDGSSANDAGDGGADHDGDQDGGDGAGEAPNRTDDQPDRPDPNLNWGVLPPALSPVPKPKIRDDLQGHGAFGERRRNKDGTVRDHKGVDLEAPPGTAAMTAASTCSPPRARPAAVGRMVATLPVEMAGNPP